MRYFAKISVIWIFYTEHAKITVERVKDYFHKGVLAYIDLSVSEIKVSSVETQFFLSV